MVLKFQGLTCPLKRTQGTNKEININMNEQAHDNIHNLLHMKQLYTNLLYKFIKILGILFER